VFGVVTDAQQPAVNLRVKGLDAPAQYFREASQLGNVPNSEPGFSQRASRAAGGNQLYTPVREASCEFNESGLVGNADEGPFYSLRCHCLSVIELTT
jgi:hypothetical protein